MNQMTILFRGLAKKTPANAILCRLLSSETLSENHYDELYQMKWAKFQCKWFRK